MTYTELIQEKEYINRFNKLHTEQQKIGEGNKSKAPYVFDKFYLSPKWKSARRKAILRDKCHDLGLDDDKYLIHGFVYVHHITPITLEDILTDNDKLYDLENLICASKKTHNLIHYGDKMAPYNASIKYTERTKGDTDLW